MDWSILDIVRKSREDLILIQTRSYSIDLRSEIIKVQLECIPLPDLAHVHAAAPHFVSSVESVLIAVLHILQIAGDSSGVIPAEDAEDPCLVLPTDTV